MIVEGLVVRVDGVLRDWGKSGGIEDRDKWGMPRYCGNSGARGMI